MDESVGSEIVELSMSVKGDIYGRGTTKVSPHRSTHEIEREQAVRLLKLDEKSIEKLDLIVIVHVTLGYHKLHTGFE